MDALSWAAAISIIAWVIGIFLCLAWLLVKLLIWLFWQFKRTTAKHGKPWAWR